MELEGPVGGALGFLTMGTDHFREHINRHERPRFMVFAGPALAPGYFAAEWAVKANTFSIDAVRAGVSRIAMIAAVGEVEGAGTLALDESLLDTFGSPVAKITMKWTERDREGFAAQAQSLQDVAEAMGATRQSDIPPVPSRKEDHHPSGATAMANEPR